MQILSYVYYRHHRPINTIQYVHVFILVAFVYVDFYVVFVFALYFVFGHYHLQLQSHYFIQSILMKNNLNLFIVQVQNK
jgi:hypothetical protein